MSSIAICKVDFASYLVCVNQPRPHLQNMAAISQTEIIKSSIALFEAMDLERALTYFTEDALYRFGNYPVAIGKVAIADAIEAIYQNRVQEFSFEINEIWEIADTVICQMEIGYTCIDGKVLTLPRTDIFRLEDDLIREMRVYTDISPIFTLQAGDKCGRSITSENWQRDRLY